MGCWLKTRARHKIYFDGLLPTSKRDIRLARLEQSVKDLVLVHAKYVTGFRDLANKPSQVSIDPRRLLDSPKSVPSAKKAVPAPPFLVPAVLDALYASQYASITEIVPGEADPYCAYSARNGGIILTSDSDMLVYDLGPNGSVLFFNQLEFQGSKEGSGENIFAACGSLKARICRPSDIASRLGLKNLKRMALEIKYDPTVAPQEAVKRSKGPVDQQRLEEFSEDFLEVTSPAERRPQLDSRVSEFVLQSISDLQTQPYVYLPFLIDDSSRVSAWDVSSSIRVSAYSCLNVFYRNEPKYTFILEHTRKGHRIVSNELPLLSSPECISSSSTLLSQIHRIQSSFPDPLYPPRSWLIFALLRVLDWYMHNDKTPPSRQAMLQCLTGAASRTWTWEHIHAQAQMQAVLYALRMHQQILVWMSDGVEEALPPPVEELKRVLGELPKISEMMLGRMEMLQTGWSDETIAKLLHKMNEMLALNNPHEDSKNIAAAEIVAGAQADEVPGKKKKNHRAGKKKQKQKRNKEDDETPGGERTRQVSGSRFALLVAEEAMMEEDEE